MLVLGLDVETTGLDSEKDQIIEIGAVLWDTKRNLPIKMLSHMIKCEKPVPAEITTLTGIENSDLENWGVMINQALQELRDMSTGAHSIVAHNGNAFDRKFFLNAWKAWPQYEISLPWIDTVTDLPFDAKVSTRKLSYLAAETGFLNPFAHRALFDVLTMLKVMSQFDFEKILDLSASPVCRLVAQVSYEKRDLAKAQGFRWDPGQRHWYLEAKEVQLQGREFPFEVMRI